MGNSDAWSGHCTTWADSTLTRTSWTRREMYQRALRGKEKAWAQVTRQHWTRSQLGHTLRGPGQAGRGQEDVPAGTARIREGVGPDHHHTEHGQQLRRSVRGPWQAG